MLVCASVHSFLLWLTGQSLKFGLVWLTSKTAFVGWEPYFHRFCEDLCEKGPVWAKSVVSRAGETLWKLSRNHWSLFTPVLRSLWFLISTLQIRSLFEELFPAWNTPDEMLKTGLSHDHAWSSDACQLYIQLYIYVHVYICTMSGVWASLSSISWTDANARVPVGWSRIW